MTRSTTSVPLAELATGATEHPVTVVIGEVEAVILAPATDDDVELLIDGVVLTWQPATLAQAVTTVGDRVRILSGAVRAMDHLRRQALALAASEREANEQTMREIRDYAVRAAEDGSITEAQLEAFVREFDLDEPTNESDEDTAGEAAGDAATA